MGEEVWLSRSDWQPDGRRYRQFRRKIRKARDANVEMTSPGDLPQDEMERVSDAWALAHGGKRGFSMGHFKRNYVSGERCYLARVGGLCDAPHQPA